MQYSSAKRLPILLFFIPLRARFWHAGAVLDRFDAALLNLVQLDDARTADSLARDVPLSPSAIARRLRRLRHEGWIARTIALLSPRLTGGRLRALLMIQLHEHAPAAGLDRLRARFTEDPVVQWCAEISGTFDLAMLVDCRDMDSFGEWADREVAANVLVRRYETSFIKRQVKFSPFVPLAVDES